MKGVLKFMKNYLFEIIDGDYEGEEFFVQANDKAEAIKIAKDVSNGEKVRYYGVYSDEEAERMGYDTY